MTESPETELIFGIPRNENANETLDDPRIHFPVGGGGVDYRRSGMTGDPYEYNTYRTNVNNVKPELMVGRMIGGVL